MTPKRPAWQPQLRHTAAAAVGLVLFAVVYTYSGDSDLLMAVTSGLGGSLLFYLAALFSGAARGKE